MNTPTPADTGFKRQVVFRVGPEDWALLQSAAAEHGSIQAAVIAGLRGPRPEPGEAPEPPTALPDPPGAAEEPRGLDVVEQSAALDTEDEITAREAAELLGLKANTIRGYIRSGRLPGRYGAAPEWRGWLVSRREVSEYQAQRA